MRLSTEAHETTGSWASMR